MHNPLLNFFSKFIQNLSRVRVSCSGRFVQEKMFRLKNPGGNCPGVSFIGVNKPGGNCRGGKLFRSNYPEGKSLEGNFLGENFIEGSCPGVNCPGGNIQGK